MIALSVLLGIFIGVAALVFLALFAAILTTGLYFIIPRLQETFAAVPFSVLWRHYRESLSRPLLTEKTPEQPPVFVVLCQNPIKEPAYLVGLSRGRVVFTNDKREAKALELGDLAVRAWLHTLDDRHGVDCFVCYAERRES